MKKVFFYLLMLNILVISCYSQNPVIVDKPQWFQTWIKVNDSVRAKIYFQGFDTLATKSYARHYADSVAAIGGGGSGNADSLGGHPASYYPANSDVVKYTDTVTMLMAYQIALNSRVKYTDTAGMLAAYAAALNLRMKYSDTTAMLAAYLTVLNGKQSQLNGTGFVKASGTTISYDNSSYLTLTAAIATYLPLTGGTLSGLLTLPTINITSVPTTTDTTNYKPFGIKSDGTTSQLTYWPGNGGGTIDTTAGVTHLTTQGYVQRNFFPLTGGSITGTAGAGYIGLLTQSIDPTALVGQTLLYRPSTGGFAWRHPNGFSNIFNSSVAHTSDRNYWLTDRSDTLAVRGDTVISNPTNFVTQNQLRSGNSTSSFDSLYANNLVNHKNIRIGDSSTVTAGQTITTQGNSITFGTGGSPIVNGYAYKFTQSYGDMLKNNGSPGDLVSNHIPFTNPPIYIAGLSRYITTMWGTNEANTQLDTAVYRADYISYLDSIISKGGWPKSRIVVLGCPYSNIGGTIPLSAYAAIDSQVAATLGLRFVENYHYMLSHGGNSLLFDALHPNNIGHNLLASHAITILNDSDAAGNLYVYNNITTPRNVSAATATLVNTMFSDGATGSWTFGLNPNAGDKGLFYNGGTTATKYGFGLTSTGDMVLSTTNTGALIFSSGRDYSNATRTNSGAYFQGAFFINGLGKLSWSTAGTTGYRLLAYEGGTATTTEGIYLNFQRNIMGITSGNNHALVFGVNKDTSMTLQNGALGINTNSQIKLIQTPTASSGDSILFQGNADSLAKKGSIARVYSTLDTRYSQLSSTPIVRSGNDLTTQTTAQTISTYTNGAANGVFNVAGYVNVTAVTLDVIQLQVTYTDENSNSVTQVFYGMSASPSAGIGAIGNSNYAVMGNILVKASTTITIATVLTTGTGSITYDAGATITQIR